MEATSMDAAKIEAEIAKLIAESGKLVSEAAKLNAETSKLNAEAAKVHRERYWLPAVYITGLFAAAFTLAKLFVH